MRLERIFTHRVIRLLQVVLPILVIGLVAVPAWNYYARRAKKIDSPRLEGKLPSGVSVRTEGFTYSRSEGGRTQFTVHAKQSLGLRDDKYILQDVNVTVYGSNPQDPTRTMRGENCTYEETTSDVTCTGSVQVHLDADTIVRTDTVIYSHNSGTVMAPHQASIEKTGARGEANRFEYGMSTGVLKLNGGVKIETEAGIRIETDDAVFHQKENWTAMSGGVLVKSLKGWIRGSTGRATLWPETFSPKTIVIEGEVNGESQARESDIWKLRADWIETELSATGDAERIRTRGRAEIEKIAGDTHQRLNGDQIDAKLRNGTIDGIEARQNAQMTFGPGQTLTAAEIWTNVSGSVRTSGDSILTSGDSTIEGRDFVIENAQDAVTFSTLQRAVLRREGAVSSSDQTRARFQTGTNALLELRQNGNFQFRTSLYEGRAETGRFEDGGTVVTLEGSPVVTDAEKRLEAGLIRINQKDNSFVATKSVSTLLKDPREPVLVKAARAEGGANSILYSGNVQLWSGEVYIKAERLNATGQGRTESRVRAEAAPGGKVQSTLQNIRATSDTLDYDGGLGIARYLGSVRAQRQDMILETPDMTVRFGDNSVAEIVASGGVVVTRADQRGTGDRAVYDAATDVVTLTGTNAQVRDKEHGLTQGSTLTIKNKGETATVDGGERGRTLTRYPIKNGRK